MSAFQGKSEVLVITMSAGPCRCWRAWQRSGRRVIGPSATVWNSLGQGLSTIVLVRRYWLLALPGRSTIPMPQPQRFEQRLELVFAPMLLDQAIDPGNPVVKPASGIIGKRRLFQPLHRLPIETSLARIHDV